jgi:hypothetical protein
LEFWSAGVLGCWSYSYALGVMGYALCVIGYALCVMRYECRRHGTIDTAHQPKTSHSGTQSEA